MDTNTTSLTQKQDLNQWYQSNLGESWYRVLFNFLDSPEMENIRKIVLKRRELVNVLPSSDIMFSAFRLTPFNEVRVVILGQDPYHTPGLATGLAFSSGKPYTYPPSLVNILREVNEDEYYYDGSSIIEMGDLSPWARQGVLLINTAFTVEQGNPGSHTYLWQPFTKAILKALGEQTGIIYVLWGSHAKSYKSLINTKFNYILEAAHPSPLSAHNGFFGCKHFSKINKIIEDQNGNEFKINW